MFRLQLEDAALEYAAIWLYVQKRVFELKKEKGKGEVGGMHCPVSNVL